ncbi:breast cancer type 2 susceptibility protein homolog isoform X1 [Cherax quadricarinatus]
METNVSLGVYSWYKQVQKKDLGVTRKDWLQYLRKQARNKQQKNDTGRCIQDDVAERDKQIEELGKQESDNEFALAGVYKQNTLHVSPTLQERVKQSTPQNSQKRKNASQNNQNDLEVEKEEIYEKNKKPRYSSTFTPIRSPFSMFMDPGEHLVLRKGDTETPDLSRVSSLYSPAVPISDIYSPGRSIVNTTGDVVASLGGNLDDSLVSWTSALATPSAQAGGPPQQVSPSTLERLTLHPRQGLRQNVMVRSLFSPCTAAVNSPSTSDEYNPSLGIIKCLSPIPVFINRLTDTLTKKVDNESKEKLLDSETQGFNVILDRSDMESVEDDNYQKASCTEDKIRDKIPCEMDNKYPLDTTPEVGKICNAKRPERTSTPVSVTPQSKTSLLPRHLVLSDDLPELLEHYEKAQITQVMQTPERNVNVIEREHTDDLGMLGELDAAEDSGKLSQKPFDLICSPVKKVNCRKSVEVINSDARQKLLKDLNASNTQKVKIVNSDTNIKNPDGEEQLFSTRNIKEIRNPEPGLNNRDNKNVNHPLNIDNPTSKKSPPQQNENERNRSSTKIINEKAEKKVSELKENCMAKNKCTDNEQFISELKAAPEKSGLSITVHTSHGSLSSPLFKKIPSNYPDSNHACTLSDSTESVTETLPMPSEPLQTKSILNKFALRKKKYSGKFSYPSKSEESYEKLKMKYTETIGLIGRTKNSLLESEMPTSKTVKSNTGKSPLKLLTDIHNIANKQQNFLSLTSLEKDARFETNVIPLLNEKTYSHLGKEKENSSSSGNQEVPLNQEKVENQQSSSRILSVTSLGARNAVSNKSVLKLDHSFEEPCEKFIEERFTKNTDLTINIHDTNKISEDLTKMFDDKQKKGEETRTLISELQVVPQRELTKECASPVSSHNDVHLKNDHLISQQVLMQVGSSQIMDDSLNDVYFSELDINSCVPVMGDRDTRKTDKTKHSCEASLQVIGATSSKCTVESGERHVNDGWDKKMSGFYTGQGKQMKLSKEALEHAKELLEESSCDKSSKDVFRTPNNEYIPCDSLDRVNANDENHQVIALQSMNTNFPVVCGFMTARGSRVTVNPAALEKAKNLWKEENCATVFNAENVEVNVTEYSKCLNQTLRNVSESVYDGLTRDRGIIQVQNESLPSRSFEVCPDKSKDNLDSKISDAVRNNIHHSSPLVNKNEPISALNEKLSKGEFQGFSTASGYKVNISSEALKKAQLLWEENNRDDDHEENHLTINRDRNPRHRSNLHDLLKLQECGKICCTKPTVRIEKQISVCSEGNLNVKGGTGKSGYNSTSPKFKNSEGQDTKFGSCLLEAENLSCVYSDLVDDVVLEKSIRSNMKPKLKNDSSPVSHSDQDCVACISHEATNTDHVNDSDERHQQTEEKNLPSFKTAGGRRISVNETALVRANKLWDESNRNEIGAGNVILYPDEKTELILSSRNETLGKEANVSANQAEENTHDLNNTSAVGNAMSSLTKQINKPLNNTWDEPEPFGFSKPECTKISLNSDPLYAVPSFATGRGKQVLVSKEALCKAKQILSEEVLASDVREVSIFTQEFTCSKKSIMKFEGFSTAGGNKMHVSQSALIKAQKFLTEENVDEKQINIESKKETSSNKCNIKNYSVPSAGIIGHLVLGNKVESSNSAYRETETIPPLLAHFSESREIRGTGKHIMEENVLSDTPQDHTLEASVVNILVNETRKTDENNDASKGTRQNLSGKTKLSSSAETPDLQLLIENKIKNDFGKDTPNILKVLKETNCRTENGTEESSDTPFINAEMNGSSCINKSISRTPESYGIRNKFVDTGETKDYTQTSSSTTLVSQKPNWKDRTNYVDDQSVVNKNTPAQQHS